jgi:hypothetical protein
VATATSTVALFLLSIGIVGFLYGAISIPVRAVLIIVACIMVLYPIGFSVLGLLPVVIGTLIFVQNRMTFRKRDAAGSARA